jgi:hypothetical protein
LRYRFPKRKRKEKTCAHQQKQQQVGNEKLQNFLPRERGNRLTSKRLRVLISARKVQKYAKAAVFE